MNYMKQGQIRCVWDDLRDCLCVELYLPVLDHEFGRFLKYLVGFLTKLGENVFFSKPALNSNQDY